LNEWRLIDAELDAVEVVSAELIGGADLDNTELADSSTRGA
jgi:hypothetical protein